MCYPACKRDAISVVPGNGPFLGDHGGGFSLIELMIVEAILAILSAIALST
jgi:prepilin-type N-terminal cleavage/methylation domain-containing protein